MRKYARLPYISQAAGLGLQLISCPLLDLPHVNCTKPKDGTLAQGREIMCYIPTTNRHLVVPLSMPWDNSLEQEPNPSVAAPEEDSLNPKDPVYGDRCLTPVFIPGCSGWVCDPTPEFWAGRIPNYAVPEKASVPFVVSPVLNGF